MKIVDNMNIMKEFNNMEVIFLAVWKQLIPPILIPVNKQVTRCVGLNKGNVNLYSPKLGIKFYFLFQSPYQNIHTIIISMKAIVILVLVTLAASRYLTEP